MSSSNQLVNISHPIWIHCALSLFLLKSCLALMISWFDAWRQIFNFFVIRKQWIRYFLFIQLFNLHEGFVRIRFQFYWLPLSSWRERLFGFARTHPTSLQIQSLKHHLFSTFPNKHAKKTKYISKRNSNQSTNNTDGVSVSDIK